jgi:hypothetical protein
MCVSLNNSICYILGFFFVTTLWIFVMCLMWRFLDKIKEERDSYGLIFLDCMPVFMCGFFNCNLK